MVQLNYDIANGVGLNYHYVLTKDISLSELEIWFPIGTEEYPFRGTFDGKGHSLKLGILGTFNGAVFPRWPIFEVIEGAVIRNLKIEKDPEPQWIPAFINGNSYSFGFIVSRSINSIIENVWLKDLKVMGITNSPNIGLIAGKVEGSGIIRNCLISNLDISIALIGNVALDLISPDIYVGNVRNCLITSSKVSNSFKFISGGSYGNIYCDLSGNSEVDPSVPRCSITELRSDEILNTLGPAFGRTLHITIGIPYLKQFFWEGDAELY